MDSLEQARRNHPRTYKEFKYVYPVISRRAGGVSIGINLNTDKNCNFDCPYCQVDRTVGKGKIKISVTGIMSELEEIFTGFSDDGVCRLEKFKDIPDQQKKIHDIALSGDGEPTMIPEFLEICKELSRFQSEKSRAKGNKKGLYFKLVLITNATMFHNENVQKACDEIMKTSGAIWAKLDAGTESWYKKVNKTKVPFSRILDNLNLMAKRHPLIIQSLFFKYKGEKPSRDEAEEYLKQLTLINNSANEAGHPLVEVQLHSLARKPADPECEPIEKEFLTDLQSQIQGKLKVKANVY